MNRYDREKRYYPAAHNESNNRNNGGQYRKRRRDPSQSPEVEYKFKRREEEYRRFQNRYENGNYLKERSRERSRKRTPEDRQKRKYYSPERRNGHDRPRHSRRHHYHDYHNEPNRVTSNYRQHHSNGHAMKLEPHSPNGYGERSYKRTRYYEQNRYHRHHHYNNNHQRQQDSRSYSREHSISSSPRRYYSRSPSRKRYNRVSAIFHFFLG